MQTRRRFLRQAGQWGGVALAARSGLLGTGEWSALLQAPESPLVLVRRGALPVLVLAPHGGNDAVPNVPVRTSGVTTQDTRTRELALALATQLEGITGHAPYLVVAQFHRQYIDANRSPAEALEHPAAEIPYQAYHSGVRQAIDELRAGGSALPLLLDLHGQGAQPTVIHRGTQNGRTVQRMLNQHGETALVGPNSLFGHLQRAGYEVFPPNTPVGEPREAPAWNGGYTVQTYGSHRLDGIDAIQLELGADLRRQAYLETMAEDLARAIVGFLEAFGGLPRGNDARGAGATLARVAPR